jgi:hypothetical protein
MKSILLADNRSNLLATLNPILKHWGYRVLSTRKADQVMAFLQESTPCLLIVGEGILSDPGLALDTDTKHRITSGNLPFIALKQDDAEVAKLTPGEPIDVPVELFELFSFIQRQVEKHPRQNLRLRLKLPGMYSVEENKFILADVLSLSINGLFLKAPTKIKKGDCVTVIFPLFGQGKEVEVKSTVVYTILPETSNNFLQGFGVCFDGISREQKEPLQLFIRELFLKEVSANRDGVGNFTKEQIKG